MKNRKVLVFTAFADTASYLYDQLKDDILERNAQVALVKGSVGETEALFHSRMITTTY